MIRKDVKLGLAIGGVFLAVLVVYLLAVSGGTSNPPELVTLDSQNTTAAPAPAPSTPVADATRPPKEDIFAPINTITPTTPPPATQPLATAEPAKVDPPAANPADDKWIVLHNGMEPNTSTPDVNPKPTLARSAAPTTAPGGAAAPAAGSNGPSAVNYISNNPRLPDPVLPQTSSRNTPRTHVIARGETFATIAAAIYGNASYYTAIMKANPTLDPRALKPGMTINLPPVDQVKSNSSSPRPPIALAAVDSKNEYRVEGGDSLYRISMKLYGKPDRVDKLYEMNKSTIGANKQALKVGMVLKLPEAPTVR